MLNGENNSTGIEKMEYSTMSLLKKYPCFILPKNLPIVH